jgi:hypothetical protein
VMARPNPACALARAVLPSPSGAPNRLVLSSGDRLVTSSGHARRRLQARGASQMTAQGFGAKPAFETHDIVGLHRSADRHCRHQRARRRLGATKPAQRLMYRRNQPPYLIAPAQGNWRLQEKLLARQLTTGYNCKHDIDTNQRSGDRGYGRGQRFTESEAEPSCRDRQQLCRQKQRPSRIGREGKGSRRIGTSPAHPPRISPAFAARRCSCR